MAIFDPKTKVISSYQKSIKEKTRIIEKYYDQIGRLYYGLYKGDAGDVTKEINDRCDCVSDLYREIKDCELKILFEKGLKLCPNCGKENMLAYAFCFACGAKFEEGSDKAPAEAKADKPAAKVEEVVEEVSEAPAAEEKVEEVVETPSEPAEEAPASEEV